MPGPRVRRVITGHNDQGKSVIAIDEVTAGERFTVVWTTDKSPADNLDPEDGGARQVSLVQPGGSVLRIGELPPGAHSAMHRTHSVDYGIVLEGEIDMEVDDGETVHLKQGDVVVQRGTIHAWINRSDAPCKMAWILIEAEPIVIDGKELTDGFVP
jgi:quercetin dioxygenase-like cupin family protein